MKALMKGHQGEKGFTLIELLVVVAILGVISAVAVLAVTRFIGSGTVQSANTERHQADTAIAACLAEAGAGQLYNYTAKDGVAWNGTQNVIMAMNGTGGLVDASTFLATKKFKAAYTVQQDAQITYGNLTGNPNAWTGIQWNILDNQWEKATP